MVFQNESVRRDVQAVTAGSITQNFKISKTKTLNRSKDTRNHFGAFALLKSRNNLQTKVESSLPLFKKALNRTRFWAGEALFGSISVVLGCESWSPPFLTRVEVKSPLLFKSQLN